MAEQEWQELSFVLPADQVDSVSSILESFLAQAITTENAGENEFYEVAFPGKPDWKKVNLTALFSAEVALEPIIDFIHAELRSSSNSETPTRVQKLVNQDWERVWLSSFKPIEVGTELWVCPSWCVPPKPNARNIILDPGLAFGTGTHQTTSMCLQWISDQDLKGCKVLDYGSGSGILAIASILSGAEVAHAVDIDPKAVTACRENAHRNDMSGVIESYLPEQLPTANYSLLIANILAEVIVELRDTLVSKLSDQGTLLLTGILDTQADRVIEKFGPQFTFSKIVQDQWCLLVGKQN